jgi:hypothetical protein
MPLYAGGSIFSANGIGEHVVGGGARVLGLGGGGFGLADSMSFNSENPALTAFVRKTTARISGQFGYWQTKSGGQKDSDGEVTWKEFRLYFPLTSKWKLGLGAEPTRRMDIQTYDRRTGVYHGVSTDTVTYERRIFWSGSGMDVRIENAYRISEDFAVGLSLAYSFLRNQRETALLFDSSSTYRSLLYTDLASYRDWWISVGSFYRFSPRFSVGSYLRKQQTGHWSYEFTKSGADTVLKSNRSMSTPEWQYGVGLSYTIPPGIAVVCDLYGEAWNSELGLYGGSTVKPERPMYLSLGVERLAHRYTPKTVWNSLGYRAGFLFRRHYWPQISGNSVEEIAAVLGTSIPIGQSRGLLHWAAELGKRGDSQMHVEENFLRLNIEFEIGELWFERSRPRTPK